MKGVINLKDYEDTTRWWLNFRLRYKEMERDIALQALAIQGSESAKEYLHALQPWQSPPVKEDDLDLIARWFMVYQPEKLAAKGVDIDAIRHQ